MKLDTAEISSIIKEQIKGFEAGAADANVGRLISVGDGVADPRSFRSHGRRNA